MTQAVSTATTPDAIARRFGEIAAPHRSRSSADLRPSGKRPVPRIVAADLPLIITANDRARIASNVDMMLAFLDALEGDCDLDGGQGDDDCCPAGDDDPARSDRSGMGDLGDAEDAEDGADAEPSLGLPEVCQSGCMTVLFEGAHAAGDREGDDCDAEPSDANDYMGDRLVIVHGGVPA